MSFAKLIHRRRGRDPDQGIQTTATGARTNRKSMRPMLGADDHNSDDSDCCEETRAPLGCLRTSVFAMRVVGEGDDEPKIACSEIADTLACLATVKRSRRPMKPKNPNAGKCVAVVNEHELAQLFTMPEAGRTDEALLCAAKMAPSDKSLKKGESCA